MLSAGEGRANRCDGFVMQKLRYVATAVALNILRLVDWPVGT